MDTYVTSTTIKNLREKRNLTQADLAERIGVSSKTVSKWETAKGLPDVSLLQPLAQALAYNKFIDCERFLQEVIASGLKTFHDIFSGRTCCKEKYRCIISFCP